MKIKHVIRCLAMVCVLALCAPMMFTTANAASAGDGQEPAVFTLVFTGDDGQMITSAFYVQDALGDGSTYLVAHGITDTLLNMGFSCVVVGVNYKGNATLVARSGDVAFLTAPGLETMVPLQTGGAFTTDVSLICTDITEDGVTGTATLGLDLSSWIMCAEGAYLADSSVDNGALLGAPIVENAGGTVVGFISMTTDNEVAVIRMDTIMFPPEAAVVPGTRYSEQPSATESQQHESQQQESQKQESQEQESQQQSGSKLKPADMAFIAIVVIIVVCLILRSNNNQKARKTTTQASCQPLQEGTIMLESDRVSPAVNPATQSSGWQIRGLAGPLEGKVYPLSQQSPLRFGRDPGSHCEVLFNPNTPGISGLHCEVLEDASDVVLRDLQSSYGTYLGNSRVRLEPHVNYHLQEGDVFMLAEGGQEFRLERRGNMVQYYSPAVRAVLDGTIYRANQDGHMIFGRDPRNQVMLDAQDSAVSAVHCVLYRENGVLYLMDKDSTNGTYFDEKQRLRPNVPYKVSKGMSFFLSSPKYTFVITED